MSCTPLTPPTTGLFENASQGVWLNATESKGGRTCTHSGGNVTITAPNGTISFFAVANQTLRHKFFGTGNFLAVLASDTLTFNHSMSIVDFTATVLTSKQVMFVGSSSTSSLPWLQNSPGVGSVCLIGAPTPFGVAGLNIVRSDNGDPICPGPPPLVPTIQIIGEVTASVPPQVQIKDGGTVIAGPCPLPAGKLQVQPPNPTTFSTVKVGGCAQPTSTKLFTLKSIGNDCLTVGAIGSAGPFSVTPPIPAYPVSLSPGASMPVTVTFAPTAVGNFNNVNLPVTRTPASGDANIVCTGQALAAQPAFTVTASPGDFGQVLVGSMVTGSVTVKNTGDVPIAISVTGSVPGAPISWAGFAGVLSCGTQQVLPITFTPLVEGPVQAIVTVSSTPGSTQMITLIGSGCVPNAVISVPPGPFPAFGDVRFGYRMPRFIAVANAGDDTLTFTATISGPDAALFGLMKPSNSITDVVQTRQYTVNPTFHCGGGPTGTGKHEVAVVFFANAAPPKIATATLTIDGHNDPLAPASFSLPLTANVILGNVVDAAAVFDTSGSMSETVQGGGSKMAAAIQAGKLFASLIPPDLGNRIAATRFSTDAVTFLGIGEVTAANQQTKVDSIKDPPLTPNGWTAIAGGVMTALPEFAVPRTGATPANLVKAVVVLTDGQDNTAYKNPADNKYYSIQGNPARDPANPSVFIPTQPFTPPSDVKIYGVGLGTGQDIDMAQLSLLSSGAGGYWAAVDPTKPAVTYQLMKFYTQIYMDLVDTSVIKDPKNTILPGQKHVIEFDLLQGDVSAMVVMYDLDGLRLPFWLEGPNGQIVDPAFVPAGFQLRSGFTETTRFLDFVLPWGSPQTYAGRWRLIVVHDGRVCRGRPDLKRKQIGFLPSDCGHRNVPVEYGFVIGVGSNFRLQAYVTPGPVKVGEPIRLTGVPSEAGLPVTGCTVTVDVVSPSGQSWPAILLKDDGLHDDGDADDGEYARLFTQTAVAGSYTFTFRATGVTRNGEPVNREAVRSKYVQGIVKEPPPVDDECCERLTAVLERQTELLAKILAKREKSSER